MSRLTRHLEKYLELRHRLGFKLRDATFELRKFVRFAHKARASFITTKLALEWATQPTGCQPARYGNRLGMVRGFAQYLCAVDPRTEVPPPGLLPDRYYRKTPYLYTDQQVIELVQAAAQQIPSPKGLRAATYSTLFGLVAVTGMRLGEVIGLDRQDVDLNQGLLKVRQTKFNKSRWVPLHTTTQDKLRQYRQLRDQIWPHPQSPSFLLSERGTRLTGWIVRRWFICLSHRIGLRQPTDHCGPRIHDLRHRFVIQTLRNWYRTERDVEAHLPKLATYIGHGHVSDTYWYISATPELLRLATERLERKEREAVL
jgi:integrase